MSIRYTSVALGMSKNNKEFGGKEMRRRSGSSTLNSSNNKRKVNNSLEQANDQSNGILVPSGSAWNVRGSS